MNTSFLSKTPLRLPLGGGGTDVAHYYENRGGAWTAATVSLYVRVHLHINNLGGCIIKYSDKVERVDQIGDIKGNTLLREALLFMEMDTWRHPNYPKTGLEINTCADAPSKSGLGVSGAMTVGLLQILHLMKDGGIPSPDALAAEAYEIEHNRAGSTGVGWQDQMIAAHGGLVSFTISPSGEITHERLPLSTHTLAELENDLVLFGTRYPRKQTASEALTDVHQAGPDLTPEEEARRRESQLGYLDEIKRIGKEQRDALVGGKVKKFGALLDEHWQVKIGYAGPPAEGIVKAYGLAKQAGALGGKVIGASTHGSFMIFYCPSDKAELRKIMEDQGMIEIGWHFESARSGVPYID